MMSKVRGKFVDMHVLRQGTLHTRRELITWFHSVYANSALLGPDFTKDKT